jgi:hypothetical protein
VALTLWTPRLTDRRTVLLDATTATVRAELPQMTLAHATGRPRPGTLGARLYHDEEGALVEVKPDGTRRVVVPAGSAS